ncbi:MAG: PH domain-containing protein [Geminicoccaceae bacterium]
MRALDPKMIFEGEHIVYRTGYHWVYVFRAFFPLLLVLIFGSILWSFVPSRITSAIVVLAMLAAVAWIVIKVVETIVKKAYVTNRRLIYRVGWTYRDTVDVTLDRIGGIKLDQDVWQRFFGYGTVQVIVPVVVIILPRFLRNPISFRNALYMQKPAEEKPDDDDLAAEEDARLAREREEEEDALETVPFSEYETSAVEADTGTELGADMGADVSSDATEAAVEVDVAVDSGDDGSSDT